MTISARLETVASLTDAPLPCQMQLYFVARLSQTRVRLECSQVRVTSLKASKAESRKQLYTSVTVSSLRRASQREKERRERKREREKERKREREKERSRKGAEEMKRQRASFRSRNAPSVRQSGVESLLFTTSRVICPPLARNPSGSLPSASTLHLLHSRALDFLQPSGECPQIPTSDPVCAKCLAVRSKQVQIRSTMFSPRCPLRSGPPLRIAEHVFTSVSLSSFSSSLSTCCQSAQVPQSRPIHASLNAFHKSSSA